MDVDQINVASLSSEIEAARESPLTAGEINRLRADLKDALLSYNLHRKLDSPAIGRSRMASIRTIETASAALLGVFDDKDGGRAALTLFQGILPASEGAIDDDGNEQDAASMHGLEMALRRMQAAAEILLEILPKRKEAVNESGSSRPGASHGADAIFRMDRNASADLVVRVLPRLFEKWTTKKAGGGRPHPAGSDSSLTADGPFIRFALAAIASLRQIEPNITDYSADSIATELNRKEKPRRGPKPSPRKRLIRAAGT